MNYYFGDFQYNKHYNSPLPNRDDKNASFIISFYKNELKWRDFGISASPKNAIQFVQELYGINFYDALYKIYNEVVVTNKIPKIKIVKYDSKLEYFVKHNPKFKDWQLEYWSNGNIKESTLKKFRISWGEELWFNNKLFAKGSKTNLMYFYDHSLTPFDESWTIYRPYASSDKKFRKYNIHNHIMGYEQLPESGNLLVITKALKDITVWYEIGIPSIAPHNENIPISEDLINELKKRFEFIYVNYDPDDTGVKSSIELTKKYNLNYWNMPKKLACKDPFECSCKYGLETLYDLFNEKLIRDGNR